VAAARRDGAAVRDRTSPRLPGGRRRPALRRQRGLRPRVLPVRRIEWISDDEDFRADWTLLATLGGADAGFIAAASGGWIAQMGVVPAARGKNIGAWLITEAVRRMRAAGETAITLNVNVNNPHAAALYRRLGFTRAGRRARYRALRET
jgi:ribosomal protein S18 acetylase RimI-like enzyme